MIEIQENYLCNIYEIKEAKKIIILVEEFLNNEIWRENCYIINNKSNCIVHSDIEDYLNFRDYYLKVNKYKFQENIKSTTYTKEKQVDEYIDLLIKGKKYIDYGRNTYDDIEI